ncbi:MAG: Hsp20 family protein [Deltaproteobacteria bacterium]|nr:Hsp20 family protein [Deltaproteobacteria bacterium]NIS77710.1 Hsp20 family protein [Deltaproteobacteria bacterium]
MERKVAKEVSLKESSPREEMERWFEDTMSKTFPLFGPSWWPRRAVFEAEEIKPSVDIFEQGDDVVLKTELPGMTKDDISVTLKDDLITISGQKKREEKVDRENYYRVEVSYGSFSRTFRLPVEVQGEKVKAKFKDGILEIRIPKTEEEKKKGIKIDIK